MENPLSERKIRSVKMENALSNTENPLGKNGKSVQ
jgi:hypothetical protein